MAIAPVRIWAIQGVRNFGLYRAEHRRQQSVFRHGVKNPRLTE